MISSTVARATASCVAAAAVCWWCVGPGHTRRDRERGEASQSPLDDGRAPGPPEGTGEQQSVRAESYLLEVLAVAELRAEILGQLDIPSLCRVRRCARLFCGEGGWATEALALQPRKSGAPNRYYTHLICIPHIRGDLTGGSVPISLGMPEQGSRLSAETAPQPTPWTGCPCGGSRCLAWAPWRWPLAGSRRETPPN